MSITDVFRRAIDRTTLGTSTGHADLLARACVDALPFDGAGLSMSLMPGHRLPLGVSDSLAAHAERLQYTLGAGPCLSAQRDRTVVHATQERLLERWPVYAAQLFEQTPYRAVLAIPVGGPLSGAVVLDLFRARSGPLAPGLLDSIREVADALGAELADALAGAASDSGAQLGLPPALSTPPIQARQRIWVAAGCVAGERGITVTAALALLRATAYSNDLDLETTADRVISGELHP